MKKLLVLVYLVFLFFLTSCKKEEPVEKLDFSITKTTSFDKYQKTYFNTIIQANNQNFVVVGTTEQNSNKDGIIIKYDENHNIIWEQTLDKDVSIEFKDIIYTKDEHYLVIGHVDSKSVIIKYNDLGEIIWEKIIGGFVSAIIESTNNEYIGLSNLLDSNTNRFVTDIYKLSSDGDTLWIKNHHNNPESYMYSDLALTMSGSVVAVGKIFDAHDRQITSPKAVITLFDAQGDKSFDKIYDDSTINSFYKIIPTKDQQFIVIGQTNSKGIKGSIDIHLLKFDQLVRELWQSKIGGSELDMVQTITELENGDLILTGESNSYDVDFQDIGEKNIITPFIIKFDKDGNKRLMNAFHVSEVGAKNSSLKSA